MVDFGKMLAEELQEKPMSPLEIFQSSVRPEEYEYLRGPQEYILDLWYKQKDKRDTIVKMNTGTGKTLVGLLMLQSSLNEGVGPAVYLCLNNQLVEQVVEVAESVSGIQYVTFESGYLPIEFLNSDAILITTFDKLVNGKSVFGIKGTHCEEIAVGSLLVDDAHSCLRKVRQSFTISLNRNTSNKICDKLLNLFKPALSQQGLGKFKDLEDKVPLTLMSVPYWNWIESTTQVLEILSQFRDSDEIKFQWNLLKDNLENCDCFISDEKIEITPKCIPIEYIPSFHSAKRRFFLSATLLDDSELIKEFRVSSDVVSEPLKPRISGSMGERMIIAPSLINISLSTEKMVPFIQDLNELHCNTVILTPSFGKAKKWSEHGAEIANNYTIVSTIEKLNSTKSNCVVLVNRYDGIDLPSEACRILIMDGMPRGESLFERYVNKARPGSRLIRSAMAQKIEQGIGRGVRSGSDYCVIILVGNELVQFLSLKENQELLSPQTRIQIEMGLSFSKQAKEGPDPIKNLLDLMNQCLSRNSNWMKYHQTMVQKAKEISVELLPIKLAEAERRAFEYYQMGQYRNASSTIQNILDDPEVRNIDNVDQGWYLQLAAFYLYKHDSSKAMEMQLLARKNNSYLNLPPEGIEYQKVQIKQGSQASTIIKWIKKHNESNALVISASTVLDKISFGIPYKTFEEKFAQLAEIIGFASQRPENEYGRGPDILWQLSNGTYLIIEAKNEVVSARDEICKNDANQLNGSYEWFEKEYVGKKGIPVMIHPYTKLAYDAYAIDEAMVLNTENLKKFVKNIRDFIKTLSSKSSDSWDLEEITRLVAQYKLDPTSIETTYFSKVKKVNL